MFAAGVVMDCANLGHFSENIITEVQFKDELRLFDTLLRLVKLSFGEIQERLICHGPRLISIA